MLFFKCFASLCLNIITARKAKWIVILIKFLIKRLEVVQTDLGFRPGRAFFLRKIRYSFRPRRLVKSIVMLETFILDPFAFLSEVLYCRLWILLSSFSYAFVYHASSEAFTILSFTILQPKPHHVSLSRLRIIEVNSGVSNDHSGIENCSFILDVTHLSKFIQSLISAWLKNENHFIWQTELAVKNINFLWCYQLGVTERSFEEKTAVEFYMQLWWLLIN